jgi:hypothetical protein
VLHFFPGPRTFAARGRYDQTRMQAMVGTKMVSGVGSCGSLLDSRRSRLVLRLSQATLAASKARGKQLGGFRGRAGTASDTAKARAARTQKATEQARSIEPIIERLDPDRTASLRGIARALNEEGAATPSGEGTWTAATVARLRQRLGKVDVQRLGR